MSAFSVITPASARPAEKPVAATREERLDHISVVAIGRGDPIVLIPGLSSPRAVWDGVAPKLARDHQVLLVQVNGFAGDGPGANSGPGVLDGLVDDLHRYLLRHKLRSVTVIGHSLGGLSAMLLAARQPGDVAKVMVVDAFPFAGVMFDENATPEALRPLAAMLKGRMQAGYAGVSGEASAESTAKSLALSPSGAALVKEWVLKADPAVSAQAMAEAMLLDLRPRLTAISAPLTIVHPATVPGKDAAQTAAFYRGQYAGVRAVKFVPIEGTRHFIMLDQPAAFSDAVERFLKP
ncbi:alpha/beta hydrolase [Sphingomonas sinipercae]|uniref:Alpha/beta hydrolase n=1 Tax=Sphingomonas sinipercae TaxID=2714944 RepID=A0A6G7ZL90_9SPHN|nr:alpha/beta hydrolase [Sphingomonas sinipercae]QIL01703.1 alpha/beta hydrolase [Sphingomonas sinipercae]